MLKVPGWEMSIVWYFFLGGIAGGAYFTAAMPVEPPEARNRAPISRESPQNGIAELLSRTPV